MGASSGTGGGVTLSKDEKYKKEISTVGVVSLEEIYRCWSVTDSAPPSPSPSPRTPIYMQCAKRNVQFCTGFGWDFSYHPDHRRIQSPPRTNGSQPIRIQEEPVRWRPKYQK